MLLAMYCKHYCNHYRNHCNAENHENNIVCAVNLVIVKVILISHETLAITYSQLQNQEWAVQKSASRVMTIYDLRQCAQYMM